MSGLFENDAAMRYPDEPGWKGRDTSEAAAAAMAPKAGSLRERVLAEIQARPGSPEQVAKRLKEPLMNCRPRFSELAAKNLIRDSGRRAKAEGGRKAIIWEAVR